MPNLYIPAPPAKGPGRVRRDGAVCGAWMGTGRQCKRPPGYRTDHPGTGRCFIHGGRVPFKTGRYSKILHRSVRRGLDALATNEVNAMDLTSEATLLRALIIDFINRYEEHHEALMAWFKDPETKQKPRKIMDLSDAAHLIESVSRIVHRMHQIQSEGAITLETFKRVTEQMGIAVTRHVTDPEVLHSIEIEWSSLALDAKSAASSGQWDSVEEEPDTQE